jgi:ribose transport system permease protein
VTDAASPRGDAVAPRLPAQLLARMRRSQVYGKLGFGLALAIVVEVLYFTLRSPYFLTTSNFLNIGRAMAIIGVVAIGETVVIISGGFDLSVGSTMAAAGMLAGYMVNHGTAIGFALTAVLALGALIGTVNGSIISFARINPLIATLATLAIVRGLGFVISGGEELPVSNSTFLALGSGSVAGIPYIVVILLCGFAIFGAALPRTRYGRYAYAIGSNARAARLAGVPVSRWRVSFYVTCGLLAALGGWLTVSIVGTSQPSANVGAELNVITAVILGGASLTGGRGSMVGTFLGLVLLGILNNGLILSGVQEYWQQVVQGGALLVAVFYDELRSTRRDSD